MSNLGSYLWLTKMAKKVGGPGALCTILIGGGLLLGIGIDLVIKRILKANRNNNKGENEAIIYTASQNSSNDDGFQLHVGDRFSILLRDNEYALIERLEDEEHHIVPISFINMALSNSSTIS